MNLSDITTKPWILALFKRDDGERFLLGDGYYDFKDSLQHFQPNSIANDIVELQGADGQLLAGQVRRSASQAFDGYIGDGTTSKQVVEQRRRDFLMFFRKKHFYTVIYIFCDGSAIQRERGYLVDAPSVPEIRQKSPEYHVALNFEDVNYYEYAEDAEGEEIFSNTQDVAISTLKTGGLVWDEYGAVSEALQWANFQALTGDYITISDGLDSAPLTLQTIYGNAEQTTYSGKNLFDISKVITASNNGVVNNGDGTLTVNGYGRSAASPNKLSDYCPTLKVGDTAILSMAVNGALAQIYLGKSASTWARGVARTITQNDLDSAVIFYTASSASGSTGKISDIQLELGSTATSYEPYVGGTASPNPDYPQAINTVTGEQVVKVMGKNLADHETTNKLNAYISAANLIRPSSPDRLIFYPVQQNTDYTVSLTRTPISGQPQDDVVIGFTETTPATDVTVNSKTQVTNTNVVVTSNSGSNNFIVIKYCNSQRSDAGATLATLQLETGSQATSYEPYTSQSQEINLGKNLFDIEQGVTQFTNYAGNVVNNWGNYTDGVLTMTTSNGQNGFVGFSGFKPTLVEGQTYTLSADVYLSGTASTTSIRVGISPDSSSSPVYLSSKDAWISFSKTYTATASDVADPRLCIEAWSSGNQLQVKNLQLERGSTKSDFAPYFTPIELAKIGTYQDRIYKDSNKWYIEKQVGKVVLTGASGEGWYSATNYFQTALSSLNISNYVEFNNPTTNALCDHFTPRNRYFVINSSAGIDNSIAMGSTFMAIRYLTATDLATFKTWLSTHPTTVYYALATPTTTEITDETLLEQLEHIYSLYKGVNHISITPTAGAQGTMKIEYASELNPGGGFVWEDGGNGGTTTITIDGVDSALPTWTINGPATNPTLTNITTGQTIAWTGTVPAGQTLIIDMNNQTAMMEGANVYAFITGSWIGLAPGANRLSYNVLGTDQPSTLSWNNIVG